ncbi:EamA family transporter [Sphingomonas panacisoli]|uniref:EamA family transporter n=1 Tax=Sphingomonas panacisoli TaxID=1813879 RepID=A0A5B8LDW2_9SPHN|nr:DMT family transporter [Sphingomonas panacisoli]QDZ06106.1 EamA family transporter [Sphingomonas panacisoli]
MTPVALASLLMIASGAIHAMVSAIVKGGKSKMASRAATDSTSATILLPAIAIVPWPTGAWGWLAASTVVHLLYLYAMIRTYEVADFSAAYPAMRGTAPLLTAAISVGLFGEHLDTPVAIGIVMIGAALFTLVFHRHLGRNALGWAMTTGAMTALYTVADAHGVRAAPTPFSYIAWDFVLLGVVSVSVFATATRGRVFADMRSAWRPCAVAGVLSIVTYGLALYALSFGPTAPLAALRETGMVTALLLAIVFLKERVTAARAIAVFGILGGAALILAG